MYICIACLFTTMAIACVFITMAIACVFITMAVTVDAFDRVQSTDWMLQNHTSNVLAALQLGHMK